MNTFLMLLFWCCVALVFYTYIGYGLVLWFLVRMKRQFVVKKTATKQAEEWPAITLVIAAYNEEDVVEEKMQNCNALIYPKNKLHICWVTDGSTDLTNERLSAYPDCTVLFQPERQGKTAALNRAVPMIHTPLVAFTDANTLLNPEAITEMVKRFSDPKVGCVAGEKRIRQQEKGDATAGEGLYWKYESLLKSLDDELHTAVGAAGELFAIRRDLFEPMPNDTLLDDFILSMRIASKGYKIAYCQTAYAMEEPSSNIREEEKRKVRIAAGGLQSIYRLRHLLNPFRYGLLNFQYVSHRVLRWSVTPIALFLLLPLTLMLLLVGTSPFWLYLTALVVQILFYLAGLLGYSLARKQIKQKALYIPYYFLFMNVSVIRGIPYLKKRSGTGIWEKAKRAKSS
jgi:cellulose synthase/poly-beta-1,6-N-acetylglucosamine synthase-like glycosyltransferase